MKPISEWTGRIHQGHVLDLLREMPDDSVDLAITSPPYFGLRAYGEETQVAWGGKQDCEHAWGRSLPPLKKNQVAQTKNPESSVEIAQTSPTGRFCEKCGAWFGQLGLEPSVDLYVDHLMVVFRELKRVLKPTGSFYLNLGDTYATSLGKHGEETAGLSKEKMVGDEKRPPRPRTPSLGRLLIPSRVALRMMEDGWMVPDEIIWRKPNCMAANTRMYARVNGKVLRARLDDILRLNGTIELPSFDGLGFCWTRVTWIMPGLNPAIKIGFDDGTWEKITPEHRLPLADGRLVKIEELKVGDAVQNLEAFPVGEDEAAVYDYDVGYFIGAFLAEGNLLPDREGVQFAVHSHKDLELASKIETIVSGRLGENLTRFVDGNKMRLAASSKVIASVVEKFVAGSTAKLKHLTRDALYYGKPFLEGVLRGFLDGDGHWDAQNRRWRVGITTNGDLLADLRFICRVLGHRLRSSEGLTTAAGKAYEMFRIEIRESVRSPTKKVVSLKPEPPLQNFDIEVDNPSHLFATESGLVVHNHMPSSVKNRLANSWEPIFRFVKNDRALLWRVFRDHGDYRAGTWLRSRPSTPYREWMLREDWGAFKAGDWVSKKPPKSLQARSRTNWLGFSYYYELDAIREPHKTTTHARFAGGGMEGPRASSKFPVGQETSEASRNFGYGSKLFDYHTNPAGKVPDDVDEYAGKYAEDPESVNSPRARTAREGYDAQAKFYAEGGKNPGDTLTASEDTKGMSVPGQTPQQGLRIAGHQGDRGHPLGKNSSDVAEEVKESMGDAHKGWATTNLYMPHVTHHELGKNPGDTMAAERGEPKAGAAVAQEAEGWRSSRPQGWWKTDAPRTTHPLGRTPEDITEEHREKDDRRRGLDHLSLPPEPEVDPQRAFSQGGKNPGDTVDDSKYFPLLQADDPRVHKVGGWWKTDMPRTTHPLGKGPDDMVSESKYAGTELEASHLGTGRNPNIGLMKELGMVRSEKSGALGISLSGKNPGDSVEAHPDPETDPEGYAKWYFEDREKQGFHQHQADEEMGYGQQKRGQKTARLPHPYGTAPEDTLDAGPEVRPKEKLGGPSRWQKGEMHPTLDPTGRFHHEGGKNPGDFWEITTQPFKGSHFAVFPLSICWSPILSSSPGKVCTKCGKILGTVSRTSYVATRPSAGEDPRSRNQDRLAEARGHGGWQGNNTLTVTQVLGAADCGCNDEVEGGVVLDPFAGCYDDETEVLTDEGFLPFAELRGEEKIATLNLLRRRLEYQRPFAHQKYWYEGPLWHFSGSHLDIKVTPEHRMLIRRRWRKQEGFRFYPAVSVRKQDEILREAISWEVPESESFSLPGIVSGQNQYRNLLSQTVGIPAEAWFSFVGLYLAEGSVTKPEVQGGYAAIAQITRVEETEAVLKRLPFAHLRYGKDFRIYDKRVREWLRPLGNKYDKYIPPHLKNASRNNLNALLQGLLLGDGSLRDGGRRWSYYTVSKRLADDVMEIALKCGWSVQVSKREPRIGRIRGHVITGKCLQYEVRGTKGHSSPKIAQVKLEPYRGYVYCASVPNGTLFVRRRGKLVCCGNSGTVAEAVEILNIVGKRPDPDELRELKAELAKGQKPLAKAAARKWIMLELSPAYVRIAENRLRPYR